MNFSDKGKNSSYIFHRLLQSTKPHCLSPIVSIKIFLPQSNDIAPIKMYHPDREERQEEGLPVPSWKEVGENNQKKILLILYSLYPNDCRGNMISLYIPFNSNITYIAEYVASESQENADQKAHTSE